MAIRAAPSLGIVTMERDDPLGVERHVRPIDELELQTEHLTEARHACSFDDHVPASPKSKIVGRRLAREVPAVDRGREREDRLLDLAANLPVPLAMHLQAILGLGTAHAVVSQAGTRHAPR